MRGRHVELYATSDDYDTAPGLMLSGSPKYEGFMADRQGGLIAHDLLEHVNGAAQIGPVWDELEALGGVWFVRLQFGDTLSDRLYYHAPEVHMASDIHRMFEQWRCEPLKPMRRTRRLDDDHEQAFAESIQRARQDIMTDLRSEWEYDPARQAEDRRDVDAYLAEALHRLRTGFRKAHRRYKGDGLQARETFIHIKRAVAQAAKHIDYEGQRFRLTYSTRHATCTPVYDEDY